MGWCSSCICTTRIYRAFVSLKFLPFDEEYARRISPTAGCLEFIGSIQIILPVKFSCEARGGDFYLFPSWMIHRLSIEARGETLNGVYVHLTLEKATKALFDTTRWDKRAKLYVINGTKLIFTELTGISLTVRKIIGSRSTIRADQAEHVKQVSSS